MPIDKADVRKTLENKIPHKLPPHYKNKIANLLEMCREKKKSATDHRDDCDCSTHFYSVARAYAESKGWIEVTEKGMTKKVSCTDQGEEIYLLLTEGLKFDSGLKFEVYLGEEPGIITMKMDSERTPKRNSLKLLLNYYKSDFSHPITQGMTGRQFISGLRSSGEKRKVETTYQSPDLNEDIVTAYTIMYYFFADVIRDENDRRFQFHRSEPIELVVPHQYSGELVNVVREEGWTPRFGPRYPYTDEFAEEIEKETGGEPKLPEPQYGFVGEEWMDKYTDYWKEKLEEAVEEIGLDEYWRSEGVEFGDFLFGLKGVKMSESLNKGSIPDELEYVLAERNHQLSEDASLSVEEKGEKWKIHDGSDTYFIEKKSNCLNIFFRYSLSGIVGKWECLDESERCELDVEKYVPEKLVELVERPSVRNWIKDRLSEHPSFFMPWPFWEVLGFQEETEDADQSTPLVHPYCAKLVKPSFGGFFSELNTYFSQARWKWENGKEKEALEYVKRGIEDFFEEPGFYDAWEFLRKEPKDESKEYTPSDLKDLEIFEPLEEAFWRKREEGKKAHLPGIYRWIESDTFDIEKCTELIREGEVDYEPSASTWRGEKPVFSIEKGVNDIVENLNEGEIPPELKGKFEEEDHPLSEDVSASVREKDERWWLKEKDRFTYSIKKEEGKLKIYEPSLI